MPAPVVDREAFHHAMARLGAAVNVVTTDGSAGRHGLTASAVCSVTNDPPTLLVCVNRDSRAHASLIRNGVLCVNVVAARHRELCVGFGRPGTSVETRFAAGDWRTLVTGAPVLADAAASLDCRVAQVTEIGTHSVFFGTVVGIALAPTAEGLIYFERGYHPLGGAEAA